MKKWTPAAIVLLATLAQCGCKSPYYADRGAAFGGLSGAALGAAIGEGSDNPLGGALIGAAVGSIAGSAIGQSIDDDLARDRAMIESQIGRQLAGSATVSDVVAMSQSGLSDQVIVAYVQKSGLSQRLQAADVVSLQQQGVSQPVITAMINAPLANQQATYIQPAPRPLVVEERVYVTPAYCPPPRHYWHRHPRHRPQPGVHLGFHFD